MNWVEFCDTLWLVFSKIFPPKYHPDGRAMTMVEESQHWIVTCRTCGFETNIHAIGGIRYRASGTKGVRFKCPTCQIMRGGTVAFRQPH